jgi:hypothetical protein
VTHIRFEVTHIRIVQTTGFHIDRAATRVHSAEEKAHAGIVSGSMMTSERKVIRIVYIMNRSFGMKRSFRVGDRRF